MTNILTLLETIEEKNKKHKNKVQLKLQETPDHNKSRNSA
jgi:hypothetical protein